ncbi:DUF1772 domain-containing protein [Actinoplanes sp. N902-109]|uniref:DUF1772 domain-containing protein n=1 Tax=Actinoplanes sp. (strain N902-109) TaxID=649831 RepID=UPI0012F80176|nr:DUF1772 domain-containing protein [Actinoplanes sp. N902-109]
MSGLLSVVLLLASGTVAGVLFAVALSIVPALLAMPPGRYIYAHKLLGRNWDPTMPALVLSSTLLAAVLAVLATDRARTVLFAVAAVLLVAVAGVSHLANVPINKQLRELDPDRMPVQWQDPRRLWRRWHLLRTGFAVLALALIATAITVG